MVHRDLRRSLLTSAPESCLVPSFSSTLSQSARVYVLFHCCGGRYRAVTRFNTRRYQIIILPVVVFVLYSVDNCTEFVSVSVVFDCVAREQNY